MKLIVLVRHAVNEYVAIKKLAGWTPGVHLNDEGRRQAELLAQRLATSRQPFHALYTSPLERTRETAAPIAAALSLEACLLEGVGEVRFGEWEGRGLEELGKEELWRMVQTYPSGMTFPGGETFRAMQARAVNAVESVAAALEPKQAAIVVSHADVIKAIVAHYAGIHLDHFQRLVISPASISVLGLTPHRPMILRLNDTAHLPEPAPVTDEGAPAEEGAESPAASDQAGSKNGQPQEE
ncbi:MAG TPA: phosphoglycerate mutase [Chloroflexi bacterium]|nr:phosphoglycerate mutase [Chloroflexota bacterium]